MEVRNIGSELRRDSQSDIFNYDNDENEETIEA